MVDTASLHLLVECVKEILNAPVSIL